MLKMSRKTLLAAVLLLSIAGGTMVAYSYLFVTSNVTHVDMQYSAVLTTTIVDSNVTLNAAVTNNGSPVRAGIVVDFYYSQNNGPWTYFATQLTNGAGVAQAVYSATINAGYDFKAVVTVP